MSSPFLSIPESDWVAANDLAFAFRDAFPVAAGHTLIVPRRVVPTWDEASPEEKVALFDLVDRVCEQLRNEGAQGFNIGINVGEAAGQTVFHLHVHVIPRTAGDVDDPAGGVRFVIPEKGNYKRPGFIPTTNAHRLSRGSDDHFLDHIKPWLKRASEVDIVAAFVMETGVQLLENPLREALARGATVRVLTGDYMVITQASALERLMALADHGDLTFRVVEVAGLKRSDVFHPKAWRLRGQDFHVAFVGSSNLSRSGMTTGVEWNLRTQTAVDEVADAFGELWGVASTVDSPWLEAYRERAARLRRPPPEDVVGSAPTGPVPTPREAQEEALTRIDESRASGAGRALIVLATGMGKTYLAAFDVQRFRERLGRMPRTLFVAHRREILVQAARTFRRVFPLETMGWYVGPYDSSGGDIVFASVQKLARPMRLLTFQPDQFDYIIIDEVHHAAAASYHALLEYFKPSFWLGLTATPERADARDIQHLFHDEVPFRADIGDGIEQGVLVPFRYFGIKDKTDYRNIPWRGRWEVAALSSAVQTQERMASMWDAWQDHPASRTLVFCCSIDHAEFVRDWLRAKGVRVEAVHSKSDNRKQALEALAAGGLDAVCAVDLFNEGVDVPSIDRVAMLRPTESSLLFLQQLGRGLRTHAGKTELVVLDFVGNHKIFLNRIRTVLNLIGDTPRTASGIRSDRPIELPAGCSVQLEMEAVELLQSLLPSGSKQVLKRTYRELREERGGRPTAGELVRMGLNLKAQKMEPWFEFVLEEGDLTQQQARVVLAEAAWFRELSITNLSKSFKMVTLLALIEAEALADGLPTAELARRCHELLMQRPTLLRDIEGVKELPEPRSPDWLVWTRYWRKNPLKNWAKKPWFSDDGLFFRAHFDVTPSDRGTFRRMTAELIDARLAEYQRRKQKPPGRGFVCKVIWNQRHPFLKLPSRKSTPQIPRGHQTVQVEGRPWRFNFVEIAVNTARPGTAERNQLPDLLRKWFGPQAGHPGTDFRVQFIASPDGLHLEPLGERPVLQAPASLPSWPELRAAAGWSPDLTGQAVEPEALVLPGAHRDDEFAVRVHGDSMNGPPNPMRDGDWAVFRWARARPLDGLTGRVCLVQRGEGDDASWHIKRIQRQPNRVVLESSNPATPDLVATSADQVLAVLSKSVAPEHLAPEHGTEGALTDLFPFLSVDPDDAGWRRVQGHLFLLLSSPGQASTPTVLDIHAPKRPSETAYALLRLDDRWRYLGVARALGPRQWSVPELEYDSWVRLRASGVRTGLSRQLRQEDLDAAKRFAESLSGVVSVDGKSLEIKGRTGKGGVVVCAPGRNERSVSLTDLAWVIRASNGPERLSAAAVNRIRYLSGTPKGSTRWIDTGYAITLVLGFRQPYD